MPIYTFRNLIDDDNETWDSMMSISEKEKYLKDNEHIQQIHNTINIIAGKDMSEVKTDNGFKEMLSRVADAHPSSELASKHGAKDTKTVKTRNVVEKWKSKQPKNK